MRPRVRNGEAVSLQGGEKGAELGLGVFVILIDGKLKSVFQDGLRRGGVARAQQEFSEKNAGHHPVGARCAADSVVLDGFASAVRRVQRLGEAETEERIGGLLGDERGELGDAVHVMIKSREWLGSRRWTRAPETTTSLHPTG